MSAMIRTITTYKLPNITFPKECSDSVNVSISPPDLNMFTKYNNQTNQLIFNPVISFYIGSYTAYLILDNNMGANASYSFNLEVYDRPRLLKD